MLASYWLKNVVRERVNRPYKWMKRKYATQLDWALGRPKLVRLVPVACCTPAERKRALMDPEEHCRQHLHRKKCHGSKAALIPQPTDTAGLQMFASTGSEGDPRGCDAGKLTRRW